VAERRGSVFDDLFSAIESGELPIGVKLPRLPWPNAMG